MVGLGKAGVAYAVPYAWIWPIRRRGDFDLPRDDISNRVRILRTLLLLGLAERAIRPLPPTTPSDNYSVFMAALTAAPLTVILYFASIALFVWPNFAVHSTRFPRWLHVLPPARPEYQRSLSERLGKPMGPAT